ncbi:MAG: ribosome rescue GTPase HflX [Succinivibrio sp.]|jgi:GTP-binding protein HflX|nr:ribosome rescue GTPase HflX [Succinivibrio sp.]
MQDPQIESLGKTVLVHVELPKEESREDLQELVRLAQTAGASVAQCVTCSRDAPDPAYFIGTGKTEEVKSAVLAAEASAVIFNSRLSPAQERNLEKALGVRVMDRIALILLIFAQRARTYEGKLQVELARLQYEQARLVRGWTHLERQKGGFGLRGGPGETQIELDRRALRERIAAVKEELGSVERRRGQNRALRRRNQVPVVSFVGYTNAGKSTLFNRLTSSQVYVADQLFATLDPTLRTLELKNTGKVIFADTVGFIRHLPHDLIAAFHSTLEETAQATLLLHVVDASDPRREENIASVNSVLSQVGAGDVPVLMVYNKSDLVPGSAYGIVRGDGGQAARVHVSAATGEGTDALLEAVGELLSQEKCAFAVKIKAGMPGRLRALLYEAGAVESERYGDDGCCLLEVRIDPDEAGRIDKLSQGALRACCQGSAPWVRSSGFDFDSVP